MAKSHWRLCALLLHAYNLRHGLVCTGFDEDDAVEETQNLPKNFVQESRNIVTFRYRSNKNKDEDFIMKVVPQNIEDE